MSDILNKAWFIEYKPKTLDDLIFDNSEHHELMIRWIANGQIDGNVLFYGSYGLGKTISAELLINELILAQNDLFVAKDRTVKEIKEKLIPFLSKKPAKSKQKIVYIEEIDKLHKDAFNLLKNGLMEKYQESTTFICCTNYVKKIEGAVLTRFNYKLHYTGQNVNGIYDKFSKILTDKDATFDNDKLKLFITKNLKSGIREMLNQLQNSCIDNSNSVVFKNIDAHSSIEDRLITLIIQIVSCMKDMNIREKKMCIDYPENSNIADLYKEFITIVHNNAFNINYDYIFIKLEAQSKFIPIKLLCGEYIESIEFSKMPQLTLISFLYRFLSILANVK